jgi:hypothetical protein
MAELDAAAPAGFPLHLPDPLGSDAIHRDGAREQLVKRVFYGYDHASHCGLVKMSIVKGCR